MKTLNKSSICYYGSHEMCAGEGINCKCECHFTVHSLGPQDEQEEVVLWLAYELWSNPGKSSFTTKQIHKLVSKVAKSKGYEFSNEDLASIIMAITKILELKEWDMGISQQVVRDTKVIQDSLF